MIDVILLGTGGTIPLPTRALSALLVRIGQDLILFDCGEGTQVGIRRYGWGFKAISTICLSHLHADHVAGLPGLLLTVANAGRTEPLDIFGPVWTERVVAGLRSIAPRLPYEVRIHELAGGEQGLALAVGLLAVTPLEHAIPCLGYRIDVPRAPRFDPERAQALGVPVAEWKALQRGETVRVGDQVIEPVAVLGEARRGLSLAYATDTRPTPALPEFIAQADLFVCEGTYGDPADAEHAIENRHMLFSEAGELARAGAVRRLWLTHFSAKMLDPARYAHHATEVFGPTTVAHDGMSTSLQFDEE